MRSEPGGMFRAPRRGTFHGHIFQRRVERGKRTRGEVQYVTGQTAHASPGLHHQKWPRRPEKFPHLRKLPGKQTPKNRMNVHAGVVISEAARARSGIVAMIGMIETFAHELGKGHRAAAANARCQNRREGWL